MEHTRIIPSTKVNPVETEAFYVEILAVLANRVAGSERSIEALAEAVTGLLNPIVEADDAKADDSE